MVSKERFPESRADCLHEGGRWHPAQIIDGQPVACENAMWLVTKHEPAPNGYIVTEGPLMEAFEED